MHRQPPETRTVACPLCRRGDHVILERIRLADLDHEYRRQLGVGVLEEFPPGLEALTMRRCSGCGLEFYEPGVAGSARFYEAIARSQQYYSTARWEFHETLRRLPEAPDLVDVGCGDGFFLSLVKGGRLRGLELNPDAVRKARARGLDVQEALLPALPPADAAVITLFQVLEHVQDPVEVLNQAARALRPGGRLFVAVPNNDAYIGRALQDPLNAPPHHPLRWRPEALRQVPRYAPFTLEELLLEPLAREHLYSYRRTQCVTALGRLLGRRLPQYRVCAGTTLVRRLANLWALAAVRLRSEPPSAPGLGFSVMAVYRRAD